LIPSPILKVLSTIREHQVQALLMGGQACVFYGAAEFSRDTDLAIHPTSKNLERLQKALDHLKAERIDVPPFTEEYLNKGHAVHFRSRHPEASGLRVDVMSRMRAVDSFALLWDRRTTVTDVDGAAYDLMSIADLVKAKKTQRDMDWPMIRRLLEAHYFQNRDAPDPSKVTFWLRELRTPELLIEVAGNHPQILQKVLQDRPLLSLATRDSQEALFSALEEEEKHERALDRQYWKPLKEELERLRHQGI
jgi:hypothetical protein